MPELTDEELQNLGLQKTTCFQRSEAKQRSAAAERKRKERMRKRNLGLIRFNADVSPGLLPLLKWVRDNEASIRKGEPLPSMVSSPDYVTLTIAIPRDLEPVSRQVFNSDSVSGHTPNAVTNRYQTDDYDETLAVTCPHLNSHESIDLWVAQQIMPLESNECHSKSDVSQKCKTSTAPAPKPARPPKPASRITRTEWIGNRYINASVFWQSQIAGIVLSAPPPDASGVPPNASDAYELGYCICALPPIRRWMVMKMLDWAQ